MNTRDTWALYLASIMSMQYHPGANSRGHVRLSIQECAEIADGMMQETFKRFETRRFTPIFERVEN